ncbi:MAG: hypothetical protein WCL13_03155 [bacterium]
MECKLEFKGPECLTKVCSSSDPCLALIGKIQCKEWNNFAQKYPDSASFITVHAKVVHQSGG